MLAVDNDFFNEHIVISDCINIITIKIERIPSTTSEDKDKDNDRDIEIYIPNFTQVKILAIEQNNYCGYILYEVKN